jgi:hypothetical protein
LYVQQQLQAAVLVHQQQQQQHAAVRQHVCKVEEPCRGAAAVDSWSTELGGRPAKTAEAQVSHAR